MKVKCIKDLQTKHTMFRKDEEYEANKINKDWYCVEAVGIKSTTFEEYFIRWRKVDSNVKEE